MNIFNSILYRLKLRGLIPTASYSQSGEDLIIRFLMDQLAIAKPSYLDLGAHHPSYLSNTKKFYLSGSRGINVEADPSLIGRFQSQRRRDVNLNVGVGPKGCKPTATLYLMSTPTMNTFSAEEAHRLHDTTSIKIKSTFDVPILSVDKILENCKLSHFPDFLTIDIEGLDSIIVDSLEDYPHQKRPKVICIETIEYSEKSAPKKKMNLIKQVENQGYLLYADTWINSIFVQEDLFKRKFECSPSSNPPQQTLGN